MGFFDRILRFFGFTSVDERNGFHDLVLSIEGAPNSKSVVARLFLKGKPKELAEARPELDMELWRADLDAVASTLVGVLRGTGASSATSDRAAAQIRQCGQRLFADVFDESWRRRIWRK